MARSWSMSLIWAICPRIHGAFELGICFSGNESRRLVRPRGEVCIRGLNVMKGYYKEPAKTAETIDKDGWLLTGDIGLITAQGAFQSCTIVLLISS